jgi:hypothetical protein
MMLYPRAVRNLSYLMRDARYKLSWIHLCRHCDICFARSFNLALHYLLDQARLHNPSGFDPLASKAFLSSSQNLRGFIVFYGHPSSDDNMYRTCFIERSRDRVLFSHPNSLSLSTETEYHLWKLSYTNQPVLVIWISMNNPRAPGGSSPQLP